MRDSREVLKTITDIAHSSSLEAQPVSETKSWHTKKVLEKIDKGELPKELDSREAFEEYDCVKLPYHSYGLNVGMTVLKDVLFKSREEVEKYYKEKVKDAEMPSLPSDGSKGQWRTAQKFKKAFLEWYLEIGESPVDL